MDKEERDSRLRLLYHRSSRDLQSLVNGSVISLSAYKNLSDAVKQCRRASEKWKVPLEITPEKEGTKDVPTIS